MELKNYWFSLKSQVYVEFKRNKILLYDTCTGKFIIAASPEAIELVSELYESENLGVILLNKDRQTIPMVRDFVREVMEKQMGDLMDLEKMPHKPIRLVPILSLQKDIDRLKKNEEDSILIGKDTMHYLLELTIFLNDSCSLACPYCNAYSKQMLCCRATNTNRALSVEELENLFQQIQYSSVGKINILGGNIFQYPDIAKIQPLFDSFKDIIHCYFHYDNYETNVLSDSLILELIVNFPLKKDIFKNTWQLIDRKKTTLNFMIENEAQYVEVERLIDECNPEKYNIHPFFTGKNLDFFRENIFIDEEDLFSKTLSIREIFRNQKLNSNFFGSLFILPDGTVKANMNAQVSGNIRTDSILNSIYKEILDNTAWRMIRNAQPCNECIYQFICPAPSNYETVIGQSNLCHIIKETCVL